MKKVVGLVLSCLLGVNAHAQSVDWTPALDSLTNMCSQESIRQSGIEWWDYVSPPPKYKDKQVLGDWLSSSVKRSLVQPGNQVHYLQNATAFGLPIVRFELDNGGNGMLDRVEIFFEDDKFLDLRSQFYAVKGRDGESVAVYANEQAAWLELYFSDDGDFWEDIYHGALNGNIEYLGYSDINFAQRHQYAYIPTKGDGEENVLSVYLEANGMGIKYEPEMYYAGVEHGSAYHSILTFDPEKKSIRCEYTHPPA